MTIRTELACGLLALTAAASGCVTYEGTCAEDPDNRFCTEADGGSDADGGMDGGGADAGPCGVACEGSTPVCDEASGDCVQCTEAEPGACEGSSTPLCDPSTNTCAQCLAPTDCPEVDAPACVEGACGPCTDDLQCADRAATPVCDEASGRCVACTADTEVTECGSFSCSLLTNECTTTDRASLDTCDACEADSECAAGRRCVLHTFEGADVGHFCFLDASMGGCGDTDMTRRPYRTRTELDSIDGVTATYCMPPVTTTCQGIRDTQSETCALDTDCGEDGLDDGYCPLIGPGMGLCSYLCGGAVDCANPLSCGGTPQHCRPS